LCARLDRVAQRRLEMIRVENAACRRVRREPRSRRREVSRALDGDHQVIGATLRTAPNLLAGLTQVHRIID